MNGPVSLIVDREHGVCMVVAPGRTLVLTLEQARALRLALCSATLTPREVAHGQE